MRFNPLTTVACLFAIVPAFVLGHSTDGYQYQLGNGGHADALPKECLLPEVIDGAKDWTMQLYNAFDNRDPAVFDTYIAEDTVVHFANFPPQVGREEFRRALLWQWSGTTSIVHGIEAIHVTKDVTLAQSQVVYTFIDGTQMTVKAYTAFDKSPKDPLPTSLRIYGDFSEVFAKYIELVGPPSNPSSE